MKIIEGTIATGQYCQKKQIIFDEDTGLIEEVRDNCDLKADYLYSNDHLIFPAMGDVHIHAREDVSGKQKYKETFQTFKLLTFG